MMGLLTLILICAPGDLVAASSQWSLIQLCQGRYAIADCQRSPRWPDEITFPGLYQRKVDGGDWEPARGLPFSEDCPELYQRFDCVGIFDEGEDVWKLSGNCLTNTVRRGLP